MIESREEDRVAPAGPSRRAFASVFWRRAPRRREESSMRGSLTKTLRAAALCAGLLGCAMPAAADAAPALPLTHAARWITDAHGRVVILHGTNMVYKLAPYYPAAAGFDAKDAAFLHKNGFNAVRVGIIWRALEPEPGVYEDAYLQQIEQTVAALARKRIVSLLDFHQDMYNA